MSQEISMRTLEAIYVNSYASRQIKEAALSFMFTDNGQYRAPNSAWRTAIWFATGQRMKTMQEAFYEDWNGEWEPLDDNFGEPFEMHVQGTETGRFKND